MAGAINVALEPKAEPRPHAVLPSIPLRSRKNAVPHFPHHAGHHPLLFVHKPDPISLDTIGTNPMMVTKEVGHELEATEADDARAQ